MGLIKDITNKTIIVGLSGRFDSAVAAYLLKKQGYKIIGLTIVSNDSDVVHSPKYLPKCHVEDLESIKHFCESIGITFYATDVREMFSEVVLEDAISAKLSAKANNTCFNCNRMRLKVLFDKMKQLKADFIATGHYAKVFKNLQTQEFAIKMNIDPNSDQSHLLACVDENILKHLILPLGDLKKTDVYKIARNFSLKSKESKEQTQMCFSSARAYKNMLQKHVAKSLLKGGQILSKESGVFYGDHPGVCNYNYAQDHFEAEGVAGIDKDLRFYAYDFKSKVITLAPAKYLSFNALQVCRLSLNSLVDQSRPMSCYVQFSSNTQLYACTLRFKTNHSAMIVLNDFVDLLVPNQIAIFYDQKGNHNKVIGHGFLGQRGEFKLIDRVKEFRKVEQSEVDDTPIVYQVPEFKF